MIQIGDKLPDCTFSLMNSEGSFNPTTESLFSNKRVVLFALPGAFTPTCSNTHLPGYIAKANEFKAQGIDSIICLSVNDAFVMKAWGDDQQADPVIMLADGGATFTKAVGLDIDTGDFGGIRSKRYAMLVEDGTLKMLNVEDDMGRDDNSSAEAVLKFLQ